MLRSKGFHKGINLGGWMSQCDYSKERLDNFITSSDIEQIARWGFDHVGSLSTTTSSRTATELSRKMVSHASKKLLHSAKSTD